MQRVFCAALVLCLAACWVTGAEAADKRRISNQKKNDLFANYYVGPQPGNAAAAMYIAPVPTPPNVGHTYVTYQPWMPHEYTYRHTRSHYAHVPGAGWSRAKIYYRTHGLRWQDFWHDLVAKY